LKETKIFPSNKNIEYFRCPTIAKARAIIHNDLSDSPQLLVIHTGTNDLALTTPTDEFISELSSFNTEATTKFPEGWYVFNWGGGGGWAGASKGRVISKLFTNWGGSNPFYSQPGEGHSFFFGREKITPCRLVDSYFLRNTRIV